MVLIQQSHPILLDLIDNYIRSTAGYSRTKFSEELLDHRGLVVDFIQWSLSYEDTKLYENLATLDHFLERISHKKDIDEDYLRLYLMKIKLMMKNFTVVDVSVLNQAFETWVRCRRICDTKC
jgi:hypothetical protein